MKIYFPPAPRSGQITLECATVSKNYDEKKVLEHINFIIERGEKVAFVGQNGMGKSTLAKIIVDVIKPTAGEIIHGHNLKIGYYAQDQSEALKGGETVLETIENAASPEMRPQVRNILGSFMFSGEDVEKKVSILSGGERARLALACLLLEPINLLVLDEPTNHLDIPAKEVLKEAISKYDGALIVVSHDRDFLADLTDKTIEFRERKLFEYIGDVNYFLERKKMDSMREVERIPQQKVKNKKHPKASNEELRMLEKKVKSSENKIDKLEKSIANIENKMTTPDFYTSDNQEETYKKLKQLKTELVDEMELWEETLAQLEEKS